MANFKIINGTSYRYSVSDNGDIYSHMSGKVLKPSKNNSGYLKVCLYFGGGKTYKEVHRLVAESFIPNPEYKRTVNHIDGNKNNNNVSNLEWATYSENIKHSYDKLGRSRLTGQKGKFGVNHNRSKPVYEFDGDFNLVGFYGSALEFSRKTGVSQSSINWAVKNKRPIFGKYYSRTENFQMS